LNTVKAKIPWFSEDGGAFDGVEPCYYDPADFPWVQFIESNWTVFRDELRQILAEDAEAMSPYANLAMTNKRGKWKTYGLMFWLHEMRDHTPRCPKSWELLQQIPNICSASFNLLEAQATIKPHYGDTNAVIRCHMGLEIPAPAPRCAFRVGSEVRSWEEGKFLMFCDAHEHTAWNNTDQPRYILLLDVMRPEFAGRRKATAARVLASISKEVYFQRFELLKKYFKTAFGRRVVFQAMRALYWLPLLFKR
jgi:aspartyl/asparaginyl beta-hydroxylase (cupin superfamily)